MTRALTPRGQERRRQILDDAAERFAVHGYHTTSVSDIVDGVGVGKGVFYWYFDSKEQLFLELLTESQSALRRADAEAVAAEPDPLRRIERGIRAALTWLEGNRTVLALFQLAATDERFLGALRSGEELWADELAAQLKDAIVSRRRSAGAGPRRAGRGQVARVDLPGAGRRMGRRRGRHRGRLLRRRPARRPRDYPSSFVSTRLRLRSAWCVRCSFSMSAKRT
jgi:AcrR family transcriptional regulator